MCLNVLGDSRLYVMLLQFDEDLAAAARSEGCRCGGVLHSARYFRKPRGWAVPQPDGYERRQSFCCAEEGCRKRLTPASLRFLGRKVYLGVVVVLVSAMRHGVTPRRAAALRRAVGVPRRTLARWLTWWREAFSMTPFWQAARAMMMPPVLQTRLPTALLERFVESDETLQVVHFLDFVKPVTTSSGRGF
jgi:hypothetical protein